MSINTIILAVLAGTSGLSLLLSRNKTVRLGEVAVIMIVKILRQRLGKGNRWNTTLFDIIEGANSGVQKMEKRMDRKNKGGD